MKKLIRSLILKGTKDDIATLELRYLDANNTIDVIATKLDLGTHALRSKIARFWAEREVTEVEAKAVADQILEFIDPRVGANLDDLASHLAGASAHAGYRAFVRDFVRHLPGFGFEIVKIGAKSRVVANTAVEGTAHSKVLKFKPERLMSRVRDVRDALEKDEHQEPVTQLLHAFKATGENGKMAILRFGIKRAEGETLGTVAKKFSRTRERVRQVCASTVSMVMRAESMIGHGPLTMLANACQAACPEGSNTIDRIDSVLESCGITDIPVDGAYNLLSAMGVTVNMREGKYYVVDPLMTPASFAFVLKRRERTERAKPSRQMSQIMLVSTSKVQEKLNLVAARHNMSRGDLVAQLIVDEKLETIKPVKIEWDKTGKGGTWRVGSLRLPAKKAAMLRKMSAARNIPCVSLICALVEEMVALEMSKTAKGGHEQLAVA